MTKKITISWTVLTILSLIVALIFMFPLYWAAVTSLKQETEVIDPNFDHPFAWHGMPQDLMEEARNLWRIR